MAYLMAARTEKLAVFLAPSPQTLQITSLVHTTPYDHTPTHNSTMVATTCMQIAAQPTSVARKGLAGAPGV